MLLNEPTKKQYRRIVDYIYLRRILKFQTKGLIKLFKNPEMEISKFNQLNTSRLEHFLYKRKNQKTLFQDENLLDLIKFDYNDPKYQEIEKMVNNCQKRNISIYTPISHDIPIIFRNLRDIHKDLIFVKGSIIQTDIKSYSICGTRNPTEDAINKTRKIAEFFARNNFTLINGYAKGVDIEAFIGAHKEKGRYIGVLASGVDNIYPSENKRYVNQVIKNGAFISQRLIDKRVNRMSLQIRNRLSAQLSLGSIFIEGNYKSGTKWQYKFAKEANKPVFYLEPKDWNHENAHVPKMIKDENGIEIKNDLSNLQDIEAYLLEKYINQVKIINE